MMQEVFKSRKFVLAMAAIPKVVVSPGLISRLLETGAYFERSEGDATILGESLFCSFEPELRGKRIAGHINKVLFDELLSRRHEHVKITTEADNQAAIRQLQSWAFEESGRFQFYGKEMVRFVLHLEESDRVEPVSRHPAV